jgi:type I restriction enzyme, S subunit
MTKNNQKYEKYKTSGVEWLGDVPQHWEVKKLKHILKFSTGGTPSSHVSGYYDGDEPWVTISDMDGRYINLTHLISKKGIRAASIPVTPKGSLLYSFKLSVGQVAFTKNDIYTNEAIASFHPTENINLNFWYYSLPLFVVKNANTNIYGAFLLNQDLIKNATLLFPPLTEQTAIAAYLDEKTAKLDTAIAQKQQMIALLKERRQILIHHAVTQGLDPSVKMKKSGVEWIGEVPEHWEVKRLKYLLDERVERSQNGDEPLFMVSQIHGLVVRADYHEKAEVAQSAIGNKKVYENDLVFNKLKAHLGVFFKSTIKFEGIVSPDYAVYYTKGGIKDLKYLELLFRSPSYIKQFICRTTGIVEGLMRLYTSDLFDLAVPVPPAHEQTTILNYIEMMTTKINTAIMLKEQEIVKLKEYKSTLINSAVTGKIRVKSEK